MAKRIFAIVLVLAMLVSVMPQVSIGISAEGTQAPGASEWCDHTNHDGWTAWGDDAAEVDKFPTAAGKYYLTEDVDLTDQVTVSANIHLCLNDHTITQKKANTRHIYLNEGKGIALSIYDCGTKGKITGGTGGTGTVINVTRTNTFNLYGGTITGNNAATDAVIYVQAAKTGVPTGGVFNMYGGEISNNQVNNGVVYNAGGVDGMTNAQVNIYGGTIKNNIVKESGGAIYGKAYGSIHVENATITGNKAKNASAIYLQNAIQLTIGNGTKITGNEGSSTSAEGYGAAIYMTGSSTKVTLSGKVTIKDNIMANAAIADLFINSSAGYDVEKLYVNELTGGDVRFGIKDKAATITEASQLVALNGTQNAKFPTGSLVYFNGTEEKIVGYENGAFKFVKGHFHGTQLYLPWDGSTKDSGYYYLEGDVKRSAALDISGNVHICFNGHDIIAQNAGTRVFSAKKGGQLTLEDCSATTDAQGNYVAGGITAKEGLTMTVTYGGLINVNAGGVLNMTGGKLYGVTNTGTSGSPIYMQAATTTSGKAVFNMTGGEISGNTSVTGGAINMAAAPQENADTVNLSELHINGGNILNNTATNSSGAIIVNLGKVTIKNAKINGNVAKSASATKADKSYGAIYVTGATSEVTIENTEIKNNTARTVSAVNLASSAKLTLKDVTISGNRSTNTTYGAVNISNGAAVLKLQGATEIYDNLNANDAQQNLHLQKNGTSAIIDVDVSGLTSGAKVGVSLLQARKDAAQWYFSTEGMTANPGYCVSDEAAYAVALNDTTGRLELVDAGSVVPPVVHEHKLCNDSACTAHGDAVEFLPWGDNAGEESSLPTSGNYYLTKNVKLTAAVSTSGNLNLCLNGKTITQTGSARIMNIMSGHNFALTDCGTAGMITGGSATYGAAFSVRHGATFNMFAGKITGNTKSGSGAEGTIYLQGGSATLNGGAFNMYGGEISGNTVQRGGAVSAASANAAAPVAPQINIYGGTIKDNDVSHFGGAFNLSGTGILNIYGGTITGNKADQSGGAVYTTTGATVAIAGGQITGNEAPTAGGVRVHNSVNSMTISGTAVIDNNTANGNASNIYLVGNAKITVGDLQTGAKIGLSREETRTQDRVSTAPIAETALAYFAVDSQDYETGRDTEGYLVVTAKPIVTDHMHNACNDAACTEHAVIPYETWTKTDSLPTSGNWRLADNVTVTKATTVDGDLNLCLNGKTITQTTVNRIFTINGDVTLTVSDCGTTGTITGGKNDFGSVVYVNEGATFNLFGGKLTGNTPKPETMEAGNASTGAAVFLRSASKGGATFNMYGGEITGNGDKNCWGGAVSNGSGNAGKPVYVNMYGGKIYGNTALNGGAFRMENSSVVTIYGGEIYDNTATASGGAIYLHKGAQLNLQGGKITGNKADLGAGIYATNTVGTITVSGAPVVKDNLSGNKKSNLYLEGDAVITLGDVASDANIGLTVTKSNRIISTQSDKDYTKNFYSDSAYQNIIYKDKVLYVESSKDHQHCVCHGNASACDHTKQVWTAWESDNTLPASGYYYLTTDVKLSQAYYDSYAVKGELYLCLNGKTVTACEGRRVMMVGKGGALNLTDRGTTGTLTGGTQTWGAGVNINAGGTFNMFGGKISGNKNTATSGGIGAIYVQGAGATFNMYGGEISGNEGASGTIYSPSGIDEKMFINIYGGTIENNKSIKVKNSKDEFVSGTGRGGAIYANGNTIINIYGGTIKNNVADDVGGGIFATGKNTVITMTGGEISGNKATNGGGLITQTNSKFVLKDGLISGNYTSSNGAGMYISTNTEFQMTGGTITGNEAYDGAGFFALRSNVTLDGGEISGNTSRRRAGAFGASGATMEVNKITIKNNTAKEAGVAYINRTSSGSGENIKYYPSKVAINDGALITGNKATADCGAILIANEGVVLTMNGGEISKNTAKNGGAMMSWKGSTFIMKGGKITGNTATGSGGAMYVSTASTFQMEGGSVSNNTATTAGGVYALRCKLELNGGSISNNSAKGKIKVNATTGAQTLSGGTCGGLYVSGAKLNLRGTAITGNKADNNGGGVVLGRATYTENGIKKYDNVTVNIYGGSISNNYTEKSGGGMLMQSKNTVVNMYGGRITGNKSMNHGGGIYVSTDTVFNMTGGTITGNHTEKSGGGLYCYKSTANITGGNLHTNTAVANAGLVNAASTSVVTIKNMKLYGGEAKTAGALVSQGKGTLNLENCEIYDNKSTTGHGGAVFVSTIYSNGNFTNCKFFDNTSAGYGGAVQVSTMGNSSFKNCEFTDNKAAKDGGAVYLVQGSQNTMENCVFTNNSTDERGGAICCRGNLIMTDSLVENNRAKTGGGGIATDTNSTTGTGIMKGMELHNCQVKNNTSDAVGGGLYVFKGCRAELYNTQITGNKAVAEGGAIWAGEDLELHNTTITGNASGGEGYAVYVNDANFDGHSYYTSRNKMSGDVIIKDNDGGGMWFGPDVVFVVTADGLGEKTHIEVTLDSGVMTNRLFGAYHYEGGNQVYTITYGDRSVTDPEYDASLVPGAQAGEGNTGVTDVILYAGVGVFVIAIAAVAAVLIAKKKKAGKTAQEANKE